MNVIVGIIGKELNAKSGVFSRYKGFHRFYWNYGRVHSDVSAYTRYLAHIQSNGENPLDNPSLHVSMNSLLKKNGQNRGD
jgi:hypothetical protein